MLFCFDFVLIVEQWCTGMKNNCLDKKFFVHLFLVSKILFNNGKSCTWKKIQIQIQIQQSFPLLFWCLLCEEVFTGCIYINLVGFFCLLGWVFLILNSYTSTIKPIPWLFSLNAPYLASHYSNFGVWQLDSFWNKLNQRLLQRTSNVRKPVRKRKGLK